MSKECSKYDLLFQPMQITSLTVPNRIILCAMERITPIVDNLFTVNPPFHILREHVMLNHPESE